MGPQRALISLLLTEAFLTVLAMPGCFRDSITRPLFSYSSGEFVPGEETTPVTCASQCAVFKLPFVGVDEAANCFCATSTDGMT